MRGRGAPGRGLARRVHALHCLRPAGGVRLCTYVVTGCFLCHRPALAWLPRPPPPAARGASAGRHPAAGVERLGGRLSRRLLCPWPP